MFCQISPSQSHFFFFRQAQSELRANAAFLEGVESAEQGCLACCANFGAILGEKIQVEPAHPEFLRKNGLSRLKPVLNSIWNCISSA